MSKASIFMANGMEEVECLAVADMLKRGGVEVETVSINETNAVTSSHNVTILADKTWDEAACTDADLLFLPGGMPGTTNLGAHEGLCALIKEFDAAGKRVAAICAAPSVLGQLGLLHGRQATCYPGFEEQLTGAIYTRQGVITDGHITTARGVGFAIDMGLELVNLLQGEEVFAQVKGSIQHPEC